MRRVPRSDVRPPDLAVVRTETPVCATCGGVELYSLARSIDAEWVQLQLCRRCHAESDLVAAIDRLTESALAE